MSGLKTLVAVLVGFIIGAFVFLPKAKFSPEASASGSPLASVPVWERTDISTDQMLDILIPAICFRESSGGTNLRPGDTHTKSGRLRPASRWAYGPLQIRSLCLADYNNDIARLPAGQKLTLQDCKNPEVANRIFRAYVTYWGSESRLGRKATMQDYARIWNGGPRGYQKSSTLEYWEDMVKILRVQNP